MENHNLQQGKEKNEIQKNDSRIHNAWDIAGRSSGMWTVPE